MGIHKILSWAAVVLWMLLIFNLSAQVAEKSDKLSTGISQVIMKALEKVIPGASFDIRSFNSILRKNAHFFTYLVLGLLTVNAFRRSGLAGIRSIVLAMLLCVLYAISDELHQLFVPGRGAQLRDVIIDSAGAAVGIGIYLLLSRIFV